VTDFTPSGSSEFSKLLTEGDSAARESSVDLVALMFEFARDAQPDLDAGAALNEIERLGQRAQRAVEHYSTEVHSHRSRLLAISRMLYREEGFHGNRDQYYDPRNSYLNEVLARRRGIPISLGILYMAVASRAGLAMYGVSTPGHFMVACDGPRSSYFIDPFNDGDVMLPEACKMRIQRQLGTSIAVRDEHLLPATHHEIARRVLANLKAIYVQDQHWEAALPVAQRLMLLADSVWEDAQDEKRDLGLVYLRLGRPQDAIPLFDELLSDAPPEQQAALESCIRSARRMLAEMN
jgi:regulator of sirC expression with transglutaminase-like and TPR domain